MRYGYRTVYVPLNLAKGLCPETFATAVNQQYRWCLSSFSYVFPFTDRNIVGRIFHACRMTVTQRISFLSCTFYYLQSVLALITGVMPSLVMIWCFPYQVDPRNYCPLAPAMLGMFAMPVMIRGWRHLADPAACHDLQRGAPAGNNGFAARQCRGLGADRRQRSS